MPDLDRPEVSDEVAQLGRMYRDPARTIASILDEVGIARDRLHAIARREGWRPRSRSPAGPRKPERPRGLRTIRERKNATEPGQTRAGRSYPTDDGGAARPHGRSGAAAADPTGPVDRRAMATRLERFIAHRIADIESEPGPGDAEREARTLNQLTRTATAIRTYLDTLTEESRDVDDAPPPRSLSALRDELRRHLERIRDEEQSRALHGEPEPE